ncbi:MAG: thiamine-binding protein [Flavobacteriaceae bacterium]|nr:thiamine-binding protein [Flavobacteriaceae bacterium]
MNISIEFTLTPLQTDFEPPITAFIKSLRKSGFKVIGTPLSTQIYGEYDTLMLFISKAIKASFIALDHVVLSIKFDQSDYEPNF